MTGHPVISPPLPQSITGFFSQLHQHGWERVNSWFSSPTLSQCHRGQRPYLSGEQSISIPCHVNGCHWVAGTRQEIDNKVLFLNADDTNNPSTERLVHQTLPASNPEFYPPTAQWIRCRNCTYYPHSDECGVCTLLAFSVQALHPDPHTDILLPYMHDNLAQIGRAWIDTTLLNSYIPLDPLQEILTSSRQPTNHSLTAASRPYSIIDWGTTPNPPTLSIS